jgi:hypothetical protein
MNDAKTSMLSYTIPPHATLAECAAARLHELNELNDEMLTTFCSYAFSTVAMDMSNNKVFTFIKAM